MNDLLKKMEQDAEEYGQLHEDDCQMMQEDGSDIGYVCECPIILTLKSFAREHMQEVHSWWLHMAKNEKGGKPLKTQEAAHFAAKMNGTNRNP